MLDLESARKLAESLIEECALHGAVARDITRSLLTVQAETLEFAIGRAKCAELCVLQNAFYETQRDLAKLEEQSG